jgi:hypothetical protein
MKQFKLMASKSTIIHPVEVEGLRWLAAQGKWAGKVVVTRKSSRLFDLQIEGQHTAYGGEPISFSAWFVLAALHSWWGDRKWGRYVDDRGTGDWSFVRDAGADAQWDMFNAIVLQAFKSYKPPKKQALFEYAKGQWACAPDTFIRTTGRRGVTTTCKILSAISKDVAAVLYDTPEQIVARVDVTPQYLVQLTQDARKQFPQCRTDSHAISEFLRDFTMEADQAWAKAN